MFITCTQGAWKIQPGSCEPAIGLALDGGLDGLASPDAPDAPTADATIDVSVDGVGPDGGIGID